MKGLKDETNNAEKNNTDNHIVERGRNRGENAECIFPLGLVSAVYMVVQTTQRYIANVKNIVCN